jgi:hypothetical protein
MKPWDDGIHIPLQLVIDERMKEIPIEKFPWL